MTKETSFADLDRHVFNICGTKDNVVKTAAIDPNIVVKSIEMRPL
ncbi:MAG: hypothetical protein ACREPR_05020 [Brasilonema sp.]